MLFYPACKRRKVTRCVDALSVVGVVDIALQGKRVAILRLPVCSKTSLTHSPAVELALVRMEFGRVMETFPVHTVIETRAIPAPVLEAARGLIDLTSAEGDTHSVRILGVLGNDVDDPVDSV